jgi:hypothetical protein
MSKLIPPSTSAAASSKRHDKFRALKAAFFDLSIAAPLSASAPGEQHNKKRRSGEAGDDADREIYGIGGGARYQIAVDEHRAAESERERQQEPVKVAYQDARGVRNYQAYKADDAGLRNDESAYQRRYDKKFDLVAVLIDAYRIDGFFIEPQQIEYMRIF